MKRLSCYEFGATDGATEIDSDNYNIKDFFYDNDIYFNAINNSKVLLVFGRKGTGKTFIAKKIANDNGKVFICKYGDLQEKIERLNIKYPNRSEWRGLLYIIIYEYLVNEGIIKNVLDKYIMQLPINCIYCGDKSLNKETFAKVDVNLGPVKLQTEEKKENTIDMSKLDYLHQFSIEFNTYIKKINIQKKIRIIFDEFDAFFNTIEGRVSLANFVQLLHDLKSDIIYPLVMLRDDVAFLDGTHQKIKDDRGIIIKWDDDNLREMFDKRLSVNSIKWEDIFETDIEVYINENKKEKISTWDYVLSYTFYRPRDIVAFLNKCKIMYGKESRISNNKLREIIKQYSIEYLFDTIADEINIYMECDDIAKVKTNSLALFEKVSDIDDENLRSKYWSMKNGFSYKSFYNVAIEWKKEYNVGEVDINGLFSKLLAIGCVGQLKRKGNPRSDSCEWCFSYQGMHVDFFKSGKYILHNGIQRQFVDEYI